MLTNVNGGGSPTKRIEYIDAMRGFTILLVVMWHVSYFGMGFAGSDAFSLQLYAFVPILMPLFFFVSGFVMYKAAFQWNYSNTAHFLKEKLPMLVISPLIFMVAMSLVKGSDIVSAIYDSRKGGYWFTFALFEYFLIYIFCQQMVVAFKMKSMAEDIFHVITALFLYLLAWTFAERFNLDNGLTGVLGISNFHHYVFFIIGTRCRKHHAMLESLLTRYFTATVPCVFIVLLLVPHFDSISSTVYHLLLSLSGVLCVFSAFRHYQDKFSTNSRVGKIMIFIGRRTLDIYLLHYFFVYSNLSSVLPNFASLDSPFMEIVVSFAISVIVVVGCLLVSSVLRSSPILAHFLFGQKK